MFKTNTWQSMTSKDENGRFSATAGGVVGAKSVFGERGQKSKKLFFFNKLMSQTKAPIPPQSAQYDLNILLVVVHVVKISDLVAAVIVVNANQKGYSNVNPTVFDPG